MKPYILSNSEWNSLIKKYPSITYEKWNKLDGIMKLSFLRNTIDLSKFKILSQDLSPRYPEDIYMYRIKEKKILPIKLLANLKRSTNLKEEIGGTINYYNGIREDILFNGSFNKVKLDLGKDTQTLFHTHPIDGRVYDPPSVLDIVSYLANIIHDIGNVILHVGNNIEHPLDDPLVIQNSMVFTGKNVYVYYISYNLIRLIVEKLTQIYKQGDYVNGIEKFLEEMEIAYVNHLIPYNTWYNTESELDNYFKVLEKYGIIMKKFKYTDNVESYVI